MIESKTKSKPKNKSKYIANISLAIMGAGFLATLFFEQTTLIKIIQGGFEAGLVGGLADWFAVTALFRHPLNIPIPHTALLPKNREKLTNAILNVAEKQLLNKTSILEKVSKINITKIILSKIEEELEKESVKNQIKNLLKLAITLVDKDKIKSISQRSLTNVGKTVDTKKILTAVVDKTLANKYDEKVYQVVFNLIEKKVSDKEVKAKITGFILKTMEQKAESSFFKLALKPLVSVGKEKLSSIVDKAIEDILMDLKNEKSENRKSILQYIQKELNGLKENEEVICQLENKKEELLNGRQLSQFNEHLVETVFTKIHSLIENDQFVSEKILPFLKSGLTKVKNNETWMEKIENGIKNALGNIIEQSHSKIGVLIKDNLNKLDNDQLTDMMENKIGKELSWIRVNGSLCGFLIGIILSLIKLMIHI